VKPHEVVALGHSGARVLRFLDGSGYLKSATEDPELIDAERERLLWLASRGVPVPAVLDAGPGWLHTAAVPGVPASDPWPPSERDRVMTIVGQTLRRLHSLDPAGCPFGSGTVVGHGDYCLPNVIIAPGGGVHLVDVGRAGLLDPQVDLDDCLESIRGPLNPQFDESHARRFLAAYEG
jgi:kanamycin kinase